MIDGSNDRTSQEFWQLLEPLYPRVRAFARHQLPSQWEDLLQEGVTRALEAFPDLRDHASFRPWLFRVLSSEAQRMRRRDFWRRFHPFRALSADSDSDVDIGEEDPPDPVGSIGHSDRLLRMRLTEGLTRLGWDQRQAVLLYYLGGFSLAEIADLRGESLSAAKSRLSRARGQLRDFLDTPMDLSTPGRPSTEDGYHDVEEYLVVEHGNRSEG